MKVLLDERALHEQPAWLGSLSLDKGRYLGGGGGRAKRSFEHSILLTATQDLGPVVCWAGKLDETRTWDRSRISLFFFLSEAVEGNRVLLKG
jgi:hypothetical protein